MQYLLKNKIAHRDIKPKNIMLTKDMIVKIGDFGLSKYFKSSDVRFKTNFGSPCYSAPEILRGNKYKPQPIDVLEIGIILEYILIRKLTSCKYRCPLFVNNIFKSFFQNSIMRKSKWKNNNWTNKNE